METIANGTNGTTTAEYFDQLHPVTKYNKIPPTVEGEREEDPLQIDEWLACSSDYQAKAMVELWKYLRAKNENESRLAGYLILDHFNGLYNELSTIPLPEYLRRVAPIEGTEINHLSWKIKETAIKRDSVSSPLDICNIACGRCKY